MPIAVKELAIIIGVEAKGMMTEVITRAVDAPQSFADSMSASGTACTPEVIIKIENGKAVQIEPMTIAVDVEVNVGKLMPIWANNERINPSPL